MSRKPIRQKKHDLSLITRHGSSNEPTPSESRLSHVRMPLAHVYLDILLIDILSSPGIAGIFSKIAMEGAKDVVKSDFNNSEIFVF